MSNSSISNFERAWKRLLLAALVSAAVTSLLILCVLALIDPYNVFSFSPSFDRQPIASRRGLSVASLARQPQFDSAALGSSTVQILKPAELNTLFGGRFVNLSIWGGTAWEQMLTGRLFARHHPSTRTVVMSIDAYWCGVMPDLRPPDQFQAWLYGEPSLLDVPHLFHMAAVWDALQQLDYIRHLRNSATPADGFENIFPESQYSLERVREYIYGTPEPKPVPYIDEAEVARLTKSHTYPNHIYLPKILDALPASTLKILFFVPYHRYKLISLGVDTVAMYEGCKPAIVEIAKRYSNILVLDFMIDSPLTRDDRNFWDPWHYDAKTGTRLMELAARVRQHGIETQDSVRLLYRAQAVAESVQSD